MREYGDAASVKRYHLRRNANAVERYQFDHWDRLIENVLRRYCDDRCVLDLGCGTGWYLQYARDVARQVIGLDLSMAMLDFTHGIHTDLRLVQADAHFLPFKDSSFDTIYSIGLLEYVNIDLFLKECYRILVDRGHLLFLTPNKYGGRKYISNWMHKRRGKTSGAIYHSRRELVRRVNRASFEVEQITMGDGLIYLPSHIQRCCGTLPYRMVELFFRLFPYNPWSQNMLFVLRKV